MKTSQSASTKTIPKKTKLPFFAKKKKVSTKLNIVKEQAIKTKPTYAVANKKNEKNSDSKAKSNPQLASLDKPIKEIKSAKKKYKNHKDPSFVAKEKFSAALLPVSEADQMTANKGQTNLMATKEKGEFNKRDSFKNKLWEQINKTIESKAQAKSVANNGVGDNVTTEIKSSVDNEKEQAGGAIESATKEEGELPKLEKSVSEAPGNLSGIKLQTKTVTKFKSDLTPEKKPAEETDFTKETKTLDDQYSQNNLSKDKLQKSNEPSFISADNQKSDSQQKAKELTDEYRTNQDKKIESTKSGNIKAINGTYNSMLFENSKINTDNNTLQQTKTTEESQTRKDIRTKIEGIYTKTNGKVLECFKNIDSSVTIFETLLTLNLNLFSASVAELLDENTGIFNNIVAFVSNDDLMSEVEIFDKCKEAFIVNMTVPINNLASQVDTYLALAITHIAEGNKQVNSLWDSLPKKDKEETGDLFETSKEKFAELERSVESKEGAVVDVVTEKFSAALDDLNARFEKAKIENMSWLDRAIAAVKAVINTIIELKNAIKAIAKKAAAYAERIIDDPITFFGNLSDSVGQGFKNFKANIDKHLLKGVLEWLTGSMSGTDIVMPKELNFEGITSLVLQILGFTIKKVKNLIIDIIGKERFEFIEKGVDETLAAGNKILNVFKILNEKGVAGLWEFIIDEFKDLKDMLIDTVKNFVVETITKKAIEILLSLLIPGAGFIRAAQLLIRFVITLFQKAAQIVKIIDGIIDTFGDILNNNLAAATEKVEAVFGRFISLAISFLAAVLGIDGLVGKVQKFIQQKIKPRIDTILNGIALKVKQVVTKIGLTKVIDKSMNAVEKGKTWVEEKKQKAVEKGKSTLGKLAEWLGIKKAYKSKDGNVHTLSFEEANKKPVMMRASVKTTFDDYIDNIRNKVPDYNSKNPTTPVDFKAIEKQYQLIRKEMGDYSNFDRNNVSGMMNKLADLLSKLPDDFADTNVFFPSHTIVARTTQETTYGTSNKSQDGNKIHVKNLSLKLDTLKGSPGKHTSKLFTHIYQIVSKDKQLIRGHLLNHYLGGAGNTAENIMPIAKNTNDAMERSSDNVVKERMAKEKLLSGNVFDYAVSVVYENSTKLKADVPSKITMSFVQKEFDSSKPKTKPNMEDGANWIPAASGQLSDRELDAKTELENLI